MTTCPACEKAVDPLRSRFVGVRQGRVVAYCSAECAATGKAAAAAAPSAAIDPAVSPASGVPRAIPTPAKGVPRATPASGVPRQVAASAAQAQAQPPAADLTARSKARAEQLGPPRPVTPAPGVPIVDSGPVIEILHEPASGVVTSARDARTEPRIRHPDEIAITEFWSTDKAKSAAVRAGAAVTTTVEIDFDSVMSVELAPGTELPVASGERAASDGDGDGARAASTGNGARAASEVELEAAPRRRRWPIVLLVVVLLGAGGFLAYRFLGPFVVHSGHAAATQVGAALPAEPRVEPVVAAAAPAAPAEIDAAAAVELARTALRRELAATSPRVQRLAAAALARTQDREACALLAAQIGISGAREPAHGGGAADEPAASDIARLDLAYALARGGDTRGGNVLAAGLTAPRGEARDEAARLLALLGDRRGVPHLIDVLSVEQRRLGAAEHLAHLAEPRAIKVLDQVRGDPRASADDKARATVALGFAGRGDVGEALRAMLGDPHFNAFAAAALAVGGDRAARPVLEHQLGSPPLRVLAARALRRLDPALDARSLLPPLLDVVRSGRDIERIPAAEAILLLAGPSSWAAFE